MKFVSCTGQKACVICREFDRSIKLVSGMVSDGKMFDDVTSTHLRNHYFLILHIELSLRINLSAGLDQFLMTSPTTPLDHTLETFMFEISTPQLVIVPIFRLIGPF